MKGRDVDGSTVRIRVRPDPEGDLEELEQLTGLLWEELLELDVAVVERETDDEAPEGAKGLASVAGWLVVRFGTAGALGAVLTAVRQWTGGTTREVEVSWGGDVLKVSGVTAQQQEKIIDAWLARHTPDA